VPLHGDYGMGVPIGTPTENPARSVGIEQGDTVKLQVCGPDQEQLLPLQIRIRARVIVANRARKQELTLNQLPGG